MQNINSEVIFKHIIKHLSKKNIKVRLVNIIKLNPNAYGILDIENKSIQIAKQNVYGEIIPWEDRLFILCHEWGHLMHIERMLFPIYYKVDYRNKNYIKVGYKAELDCDKWAAKMLKKFNIKSLYSKDKYPIQGVRLYNYVKYLKYGEEIAYIAEVKGEDIAEQVLKLLKIK